MTRFALQRAVAALILISGICFLVLYNYGLVEISLTQQFIVREDSFSSVLPQKTTDIKKVASWLPKEKKLVTKSKTSDIKKVALWLPKEKKLVTNSKTSSMLKITTSAPTTFKTITSTTTTTIKSTTTLSSNGKFDNRKENSKDVFTIYNAYAKKLSRNFGSQRRAFRIRCKELKISTELNSGKITRLIASEPKHVMICDTPKVASTSFRTAFAQSHEVRNGTWKYFYFSQDMKWAHKFRFDWFVKNIIPTYFKFLATRNPYTRLMSAYRDKIAPSNDVLRHNIDAPGVDGNARAPARYAIQYDPDFRLHGTTFPMFLRYVVEMYQKHPPQMSNLHWRPVTDTCFPCAMPFDYVGKLEDQNTKKILLNFLYKNSTKSETQTFPTTHRSHKNSTTIMRREYSNVGRDVIKGLQRMYKNDFLLFGYNMEPY